MGCFPEGSSARPSVTGTPLGLGPGSKTFQASSVPCLSLRLGPGAPCPGRAPSSARGSREDSNKVEGQPRRTSLPTPTQLASSPTPDFQFGRCANAGPGAQASSLGRAGLTRSWSLVSSMSFISTAGDRERKVKTDPFEDFLKEKEVQWRQAASKRLSEEAHVRNCKNQLRFKANLAKLAETEDSSRWMLENPDVWRSGQKPQKQAPVEKVVKKELRKLQCAMNRSLRELCRADPTAVEHLIAEDTECCTTEEAKARASLKETLLRAETKKLVEPRSTCPIFEGDEGAAFKDRFRRLRVVGGVLAVAEGGL